MFPFFDGLIPEGKVEYRELLVDRANRLWPYS